MVMIAGLNMLTGVSSSCNKYRLVWQLGYLLKAGCAAFIEILYSTDFLMLVRSLLFGNDVKVLLDVV